VADSGKWTEVAGNITLKPSSAASNGGVSLTVPYYLVPRARSQLTAELQGDLPRLRVNLQNSGANVPAYADFYAQGLQGTRQGAAPFDIKAVGVQSFPITATTNLLVFAVNTFDRFNTAAPAEVDLYIDTNGDGQPDYWIFSSDYGAMTVGSYSGEVAVFVQNLGTGLITASYFADAPTDGSTMLLPVYSSDLGLSRSSPRFSYRVQSWNPNGDLNVVPGVGRFNAFAPAISTGDYVTLAPGQRASVPITVNAKEQALTPALGVMVVNKENASGAAQALLLGLPR
jgi:hypothetical protein